MKIKGIDCNDVVLGYIECAMWAETVSLPVSEEELDDDGCMDVAEDHPLYGISEQTPIDDHFGFEDLTEEFVKAAVEDCAAFEAELSGIVCEDCDEDGERLGGDDFTVWEALVEQAVNDEYIGHDIWLTRNGHGAGFWDRNYTDHVERAACAASKSLGGCDLWVTEEGQVDVM